MILLTFNLFWSHPFDWSKQKNKTLTTVNFYYSKKYKKNNYPKRDFVYAPDPASSRAMPKSAKRASIGDYNFCFQKKKKVKMIRTFFFEKINKLTCDVARSSKTFRVATSRCTIPCWCKWRYSSFFFWKKKHWIKYNHFIVIIITNQSSCNSKQCSLHKLWRQFKSKLSSCFLTFVNHSFKSTKSTILNL